MSYYETRENHRKEELRTRYFISTMENMIDVITATAEYLGYRVLNKNMTYHEIFIEGDCSMVITVTSFGREQGVDINCDTYRFIDFGKGKRRIREFYIELGKRVALKGVGLHVAG